MGDDLARRLRRLGVVKGVKNLKPASEKPAVSARTPPNQSPENASPGSEGERTIDMLLPGAYLQRNELGACYVLDHVYSLHYLHGDVGLGELAQISPAAAAEFLGDSRIAEMSIGDFVFLDTETTGLMGAGTFAFMVGVAFYDRYGDQEVFIVRQYFLRDQGDEPAMLLSLAQLLSERPGLVTFNGRSFDLPLLENRYVMQRMDDRIGGETDDLIGRPHIDLLHPARRLWRSRIGSCSLGSLEANILHYRRTQEDVPGWMIPSLYMDYLRTGDASELMRVFYHNRIDMLSMVILAVHILRQFALPREEDDPIDLLSLARWQIALGRNGEAEATLRLVSDQDMPLDYYHQALHEMGLLLKRSGRRDEAAIRWQQITTTHVEGLSQNRLALEAHIELAKYYEWHQHDLEEAYRWTEQAINMVNKWDERRAEVVLEELHHRLSRLERKLAPSETTDQAS